MTHPLAGVDAKIERGFHHLDELDRQARSFLESHPYRIAQEFDEKSGFYVARFRIDRYPPLLLPIIAGEAVQQFRSALDHLMTQLIWLNHPGMAKTDNFPIHMTKAGYESGIRRRESQEKTISRLVRPEHATLIKRDQPYHHPIPESMLLGVVNWFSNTDKHQVVQTAYMTPGPGILRAKPHPSVTELEWLFRPPYVFEDGAALYRVRFKPGAYVNMGLEGPVELAFGPPPKWRISVSLLRTFGGRIADFIGEFRDLTPEFA